MPATRLSGRVVERLTQAEACEPNPHYRDDLQIARLTVHYAATGEAVLCPPHVLASYAVLGLHPEKVWPAIEARRKALLGPLLGKVLASPVPKKAAQSVKLWAEKTNGARAINSRADTTLLRDNTISVPMAAPSIAALYRNSEAPSSAKKRQFTLDELKQIIHYSGAPLPTRALTIAALEARGPWPNQDGPATPILCISLKGMMLEGGVCKRTVQRRIKRACGLGFWRRTREANSWTACPKCGAHRDEAKCPKCKYRGSSKNRGEFTRPYTYEFDVEKFMTTPRCREIHSEQFRSYADYKESAKRGEARTLEMPSRKPAQPAKPGDTANAAPKPERAKPAAESGERKPLRITRDVRIAIAGCYSNARKQGKDENAAIQEACEALSSETQVLSESEVRLQLKIWQSKHGSLEPAKSFVPDNCGKCGSVLVQNFGPGPRLKCPQCSADSS